jgi:hypothetical protein
VVCGALVLTTSLVITLRSWRDSFGSAAVRLKADTTEDRAVGLKADTTEDRAVGTIGSVGLQPSFGLPHGRPEALEGPDRRGHA